MAKKRKKKAKTSRAKASKKKTAGRKKNTRQQAARDDERTRRVAHLIHEDASQLIDTVTFRLSMLLELWSKHRAREPLLRSLHTRYFEVPASELLLLDERTFTLAQSFYIQLDELRLYLEYTEDMVNTLEDNFRVHFKRMTEIAEELLPRLDERRCLS